MESCRGISYPGGKSIWSVSIVDIQPPANPGGLIGLVVEADNGAPIDRAVVTVFRPSGDRVDELLSGENGRFGLDLAPGSYTLVAEKDGFGHALESLTVAGNHRAKIVLALSRKSGKLTGLVRVATTQCPVPGASVHVCTEANQKLFTVHTDAKGKYLTPSLSEGCYHVFGGAAGFCQDAVGAVVHAGQVGAVDLALLPFHGTLVGTVSAETTGAPVSGAVIRLFDSRGVFTTAVHTDKDGVYRVDDLAEETYSIIASSPGRQTTQSGASVRIDRTTGVDLTLPAMGGRIEGRIADLSTDAPLRGASVTLLNQEDILLASVLADRKGRFAVAGLMPGFYKVIAAKSGYATGWIGTAVVADTASPVDLGLGRMAGSVSGLVSDADKNPLAAAVTVYSAKGFPVVSQLTCNDGRFHCYGLRPGDYFLTAQSPGFAPAVSGFNVLANQVTRLDPRLASVVAVLDGTVRSAGRPVPGVVIRALDPSGRQLRTVITTPAGDYVLSDLPDGDLYVVVSAPGLIATVAAISLRAGRHARVDIEVETGPCRILQRVNDAVGNPAVGVPVRVLESTTGRFLFAVITNNDGFFWLRAWAPSDPSPSPWFWQ